MWDILINNNIDDINSVYHPCTHLFMFAVIVYNVIGFGEVMLRWI